MIKDLQRTISVISDINKYISDNMRCLSNKSIYRDISEIPKRVVALGDIHGDFEALINILYDSAIIDKNGNWIARDTFLVQTGDLFDKYRNRPLEQNVILKDGSIYDLSQNTVNYKPEFGNPDDELVIIGYLTDLHQQAVYGNFGNSRVILCLGNHEYLNTKIRGYEQYMNQFMNPSIQQFYGGPELNIRDKILKPSKGDLAVRFACIFKVCVVIGNFIFLHGGINNFNFSNINKIEDIEQFNNSLYDYFLLGKPFPEEIIESHYGLLWNREFSQEDSIQKTSCNKFYTLMKKIGEPDLNMVIGHTPQLRNVNSFVAKYDPDVAQRYPYITRINSACDNRIYRIDTMMSRAFNLGVHDYREVQYGRLNSLEINFKENGLLDSVYNIYHSGRVKLAKTNSIPKIPEL
jgi:hypothetical protein